MAARAVEKNLDLAYIIEDEVPHGIRGDVTRLRQILINLLNNAVDAVKGGGHIDIRVRAVDERRVGVAITDHAAGALSAVYSFYDPDYGWLSPGVYSILMQVSLCRRWGLRYLYLGLYVGGCRAMRYKASYLPHERLIDGAWRRFDRPFGP